MTTLEITSKTNKKVISACLLMVTLAVLGYLLEFIRGSRSLEYVLTLSFFIFMPVIISFVFYRLPKFTNQFKYIALYSFMISWIIMLSFSPKVIQYVLIFPLLILYSLYFDAKLMRNASIIIIVYSIFKVWLNIYYYKMTDAFISTEYSVFILSLVTFGYFTVTTAKFAVEIRNNQISSILDEQQKNENLLTEVLNVIDVMSATSTNVSHIYSKLIETSDTASETITQLSSGMKGIAVNLSQQTSNTETMQEKLLLTSTLSNTVAKYADISSSAIDSGKKTIEKLDSSAITVDANNENVHSTMIELRGHAGQIKSIVDVIQNIAAQTNLLALNASIESARAGEAGKGFSVVAESIRELSIKTSEALKNISSLINSLESSAELSLNASAQSKELGTVQQALIHESKQIFDTVSDAIGNVNASILESAAMNTDIVSRNLDVVGSISNISAVVQEAASNTALTSEIIANNKDLTYEAKNYMDDLDNVVKSIEKYRRV